MITNREKLIRKMAVKMPLSYTADLGAMKQWQVDGSITLRSKTFRSNSLYLGPARRYFPNPDDTLKRGCASCALVIDRSILEECSNGYFFPFDSGEVLYNWRNHMSTNDLPFNILDLAYQERRSLSELITDFEHFLHHAYENPVDYLNNWIPPRPAYEFGHVRNQIYRSAGERVFGRFRGFAAAWTFEVNFPEEVAVPIDKVQRAIAISNSGAATVGDCDGFLNLFPKEVRVVEHLKRILHPDFRSALLEHMTARGIKDILGI